MGRTIGTNKTQDNPARDHWETPPDEIAFVRAVGNGQIDLDVCAGTGPFAQRCAEMHYTEQDDGLSSVWWGFCFMNPEYSNLDTWCETAVRWSHQSAVVLGLLPAYTGPAWWHRWVGQACQVALLRRRIAFVDPTTGRVVKGTSFDSAYVLWGDDSLVEARFRLEALKRGAMVFRPRTIATDAARILAQQDLFRQHARKEADQ